MSLSPNEAGSANFEVQNNTVNNYESGGAIGNEYFANQDYSRGFVGQEGIGPGGFVHGFHGYHHYPYFHHHHHYPYYPIVHPYAYHYPYYSHYYPYPHAYGPTVVVV